jgi:hypothetical protein
MGPGRQTQERLPRDASLVIRCNLSVYRSLCVLAALVMSVLPSPVSAAELGYGGRLTQANGEPVTGPVNMTVRFYTSPIGGAPVGPSLDFPATPLVEGIFQLALSLDSTQQAQVFGDGDHAVYVEVAAKGKTYPRQRFLAVPFALRIPVDGESLSYGTDGKLKVGSISQTQVSGLSSALAAKADADTVDTALASKADSTSVTSDLATKADATALATKADANATLSGDVSGSLSGPITVDKIKNTSLPAPNPTLDANKYLQYNGTSFVLATISGSSGGTVTNVTATPPLTISNGSTTPEIAISPASSVSSGYLTNADFTAFNNKQTPITASSTVNAGTLTTAQQNGLQVKPFGTAAGNTGELRLTELSIGGTDYVGFKAPDAIAASKIWTLPAVDGSSGQVLSTNGSGLLSWINPGNSGTVTSVNLTVPTAGITVSGGPITSTGSISLSLADDLAAIESISTTGGVERTAANTWATHSLTTAGKALIAGADAAAQRTTLGLGTLATASSVSGGTGGTGGTITDDSITDADINSAAAIAQSKISGLTTALAGKESSITAGTSAQYYRGDKTWQTLQSDSVTEGTTNLYFTDARARGALSVSSTPLGYNNSTGVLSLGQASGVADGYLSAADFTAFNNKQAAITTTSTINAGTLTTAQQNGLQIKPYSSTAGTTGELRFSELTAGGTDYVGFKAPDAIAASKIWTLPAGDGSSGQVLSTNGSGLLSWISPGNSGTVTSVNLTAPAAGITISGGPITSSG